MCQFCHACSILYPLLKPYVSKACSHRKWFQYWMYNYRRCIMADSLIFIWSWNVHDFGVFHTAYFALSILIYCTCYFQFCFQKGAPMMIKCFTYFSVFSFLLLAPPTRSNHSKAWQRAYRHGQTTQPPLWHHGGAVRLCGGVPHGWQIMRYIHGLVLLFSPSTVF